MSNRINGGKMSTLVLTDHFTVGAPVLSKKPQNGLIINEGSKETFRELFI